MFALPFLCEGNPPGHRWFPFQRAGLMGLWSSLCCLPEQALGRTVKLSLFWYAMTLVWHHSNVCEIKVWYVIYLYNCHAVYNFVSWIYRAKTRTAVPFINIQYTFPKSYVSSCFVNYIEIVADLEEFDRYEAKKSLSDPQTNTFWHQDILSYFTTARISLCAIITLGVM